MQWYLQRLLPLHATKLNNSGCFMFRVYSTAHILKSFHCYLELKLLFEEHFALGNPASQGLIWTDALEWKELWSFLLPCPFATTMTHSPEQNTEQRRLKNISPALCWHFLLANSHSKIIVMLYCCTFSPDTREFWTTISISLLQVYIYTPVLNP